MNTQKQIQQIASSDTLLQTVIDFSPVRKARDFNHLERRQQQRAITNDMIRVAIAYGQRRFDNRGAIVYMLNDHVLKYSPYTKFTDYLRGLQVICLHEASTPRVLTTYWNFNTKKRVRN